MKSGQFREHLQKLEKFCAYRDRSEYEVRQKAEKMGVSAAGIQKLISALKISGFLDDARFAETYAGGKLRMNGWGKHKIRQGLKQKGIAAGLIEICLQAIDDESYNAVLEKTARKKWRLLGKKKGPRIREKLFAYLTGRGFETEAVYRVVGEVAGTE